MITCPHKVIRWLFDNDIKFFIFINDHSNFSKRHSSHFPNLDGLQNQQANSIKKGYFLVFHRAGIIDSVAGKRIRPCFWSNSCDNGVNFSKLDVLYHSATENHPPYTSVADRNANLSLRDPQSILLHLSSGITDFPNLGAYVYFVN